jgi:dolichyl-diphosphooligosaccharide--protein glycosyltransferase
MSRLSGYCIIVLGDLWLLCILTCYYAVWFSCFSYSGDQITFVITTAVGRESSDDYRDVYRWRWCNERVMNWWDYGHHISSMGGRTCHADGNTNNFTHIEIIGSTMSSPETVSWRLARMIEADYMLVVFGGAVDYDINKLMWMPEIAN